MFVNGCVVIDRAIGRGLQHACHRAQCTTGTRCGAKAAAAAAASVQAAHNSSAALARAGINAPSRSEKLKLKHWRGFPGKSGWRSAWNGGLRNLAIACLRFKHTAKNTNRANWTIFNPAY